MKDLAIRAFQPQLVPLIANLPKADVEFGSLVSIGETTNGTYGIALYVQLVKPKIFYGGHADNFNIGASPYYHRALRKQLEVFGVSPADHRKWPTSTILTTTSRPALPLLPGRTSAGAKCRPARPLCGVKAAAEPTEASSRDRLSLH